MQGTHTMTQGERMCLKAAARDLRQRFRGVFGEETIEAMRSASYAELDATATVRSRPAICSESIRPACAWPQALAHARIEATGRKPSVLFLCVHNAGRSQMALGWFTHLAGDQAIAWSGGSEAAAYVSPQAVAVMAEAGIDISDEFPKLWTDEFLLAADVVITMGCGDACPLLPGKRYEDWEDPRPGGQDHRPSPDYPRPDQEHGHCLARVPPACDQPVEQLQRPATASQDQPSS